MNFEFFDAHSILLHTNFEHITSFDSIKMTAPYEVFNSICGSQVVTTAIYYHKNVLRKMDLICVPSSFLKKSTLIRDNRG